MTRNLFPDALDFRNKFVLYDDSDTSPACPSDKIIRKTKMNWAKRNCYMTLTGKNGITWGKKKPVPISDKDW